MMVSKKDFDTDDKFEQLNGTSINLQFNLSDTSSIL